MPRARSNDGTAARSRVRGAATVGLMITVWAGAAGAAPVQDAERKLGELEERTRELSSSFRQSYPLDPSAADRRVIEAEKLYALKNYGSAAILCLAVIEHYPQSRAFDDATLLLAESLYKDGDLLSAKRYFVLAAKKGDFSLREQRALQRIVEIALRTGDFSGIDEPIGRLSQIPRANQDPAVPYVRGKYYYFRDRPGEALTSFESIGPSEPYYLQARYFIGTIQVKGNDYASAARSFDEVLKVQPKDDGDKEIQDLARLAIGRLLYDRGQFDRAKQWYASVPRQSKHFADAMYESAWNAIKSSDFKSAYRALDLMMLQEPDSTRAPELRLLIGNLHLRLNNYYLASTQFTQTLSEFEPIYRDLISRQEQARSDPRFFDRLVNKGMDKFDIASVIPRGAVKLVAKEPDMAKLLVVADDVGTLQRGIRESALLVIRLEKAVSSGHIVGMFRDLASAQSKSTAILNQTLEVRRRFQDEARALAVRYLSAEDRVSLEGLAGERGMLEQELRYAPLTQESMNRQATDARGMFAAVDAQASELNVLLRSLDAEMVAIEQYFIQARADEKIKPGVLQPEVDGIRKEIGERQDGLGRIRDDIAVAAHEATLAGAAGTADRATARRLVDLLQREQGILRRARFPDGADTSVLAVLRRSDTILATLVEFDGGLDKIADQRLGEVRSVIAAEKANLELAGGTLSTVLSESQNVGGSLAAAMMGRATERFYDLTVQSDVGLIDVSWGLKEGKTQSMSKLINQQRVELQAADDDFQPLLREDDK
jgi:TolA-binding protein